MPSLQQQESSHVAGSRPPRPDAPSDLSTNRNAGQELPAEKSWQDNLRWLVKATVSGLRAVARDLRRGDPCVILATIVVLTLFACGLWSAAGPHRKSHTSAGRSNEHAVDIRPGLPQSPSRSAATNRGSSPARGRIDRVLVGNWRRTNSTVVRAGSGGGLNLATDVYCRMNSDGTFVYGGAQTAYSGRGRYGGSSGTSGAGGVTRGHWKVAGRVLYSKSEGSTQWIALGRYAVSGNSLVIYPAGGGRQFWER